MNSEVEFFIDPEGRPGMRTGDRIQLVEPDDIDIILPFNRLIEDNFTKAYMRVQTIYASCEDRQFRMFRRMIRCNCPIFDMVPDHMKDGSFNWEKFYCPLRGECQDENVICNPQPNTNFTKKELEIIRMIASGMTENQIADELCLSVLTIKSHRQNIQRKSSINTKVGVIEMARKKLLL